MRIIREFHIDFLLYLVSVEAVTSLVLNPGSVTPRRRPCCVSPVWKLGLRPSRGLCPSTPIGKGVISVPVSYERGLDLSPRRKLSAWLESRDGDLLSQTWTSVSVLGLRT